MKKYYITTPIYYVNDVPHIGHAYTTIAADVLARHYRKKLGAENVRFMTGTDEHGKKNTEAAEKAGLEPQAFVDEQAEKFEEIWTNLNISYDVFARTTNPDHYASVSRFMQTLYEKGDIYEGNYKGLYCVGCEKFLTEKELVDGKCPDHRTVPQAFEEKNYFFRLTKYLDDVRKLIETGELLVEPASRKSEVLGLFKQGLEDFSVSRESVAWGVPVPWDEKQTVYVWVEALQNYTSFAGFGLRDEEFEKWWPADLHLMAKDILKFHAVYWPALLAAAGLKLPKRIFAHGFFTVNGQKMSKTLGNVINPTDMIEQFGVDATRYLLLTQFPFGQDGDIQASRFVEKYNADLAGGLGNLVSRITSMVVRYTAGAVKDRRITREYNLGELEQGIQNLQFSEVLESVWAMIAETNRKINDHEPWKLAEAGKMKDVEKVLAEAVLRLRDIGTILESFMPDTSEAILTALADLEKITKPENLFDRK
ncbi:MAG: methionine--tRNA ligase [Candidatus Kerfeldbacteria bacterium]|nr:methionine--tRNA ligase [Candidatus Kerfeldbacteria bacterium]